MRILLSVLALCLLSGCANVRLDRTDNAQLWQPLDREKIYVVATDVFLLQTDRGLEPKRLALVPPSTPDRGGGYESSPRSIEAYRRNPDAPYLTDRGCEIEMDVVGVVEAGTQVAPCKLKQNLGWSMWFGTHAIVTKYGKILSGTFAGKVADLSDLIFRPRKGYLIEAARNGTNPITRHLFCTGFGPMS